MNFCTLEYLYFFVAVFGVYWAMASPRVRLTFLVAAAGYFTYQTVDYLFFHTSRSLSHWLMAMDAKYWMAAIVLTTTALAYRVGPHRARVWLLLGVSFFFYACFNKWLATIICVSTAMDYVIARGLDKLSSQRWRRLLLAISLTANLGLLAYFKYANFFLDSLNHLLHALGTHGSFDLLQVILPIGISFYTFEAINYTIDVYRRKVPAEKDLGNFMLFITFFPHLVAGPIVRARDFLPQIHRRKHFSWARMQLGVQYALMGLFKKWAIADRMALFAGPVFKDPGYYNTAAVWLAVLAFALQIYCDFSGYTDMALGCAHMLGYKLAQNFNMPYIARNVSEFWHRWHISLSTWLRDYLFIPLGGSRGGTWMIYRNLMITMTLGGLWHGANWNFVIWGVLHGLFLIIHRVFRAFADRHPLLNASLKTYPGAALCMLVTFLSVCLGWVFFRCGSLKNCNNLAVAMTFLHRLVKRSGGMASPLHYTSFWVTVAVVVLCHILAHRGLWKRVAPRLPAPVMGFGYSVILTLALVLAPATGKTFIYFQF